MAEGQESSGKFLPPRLVPGLEGSESWTQLGHCELVFLCVSFPVAWSANNVIFITH